eukprot:24725-Pyramimonas_sp.AAC.1
MLGQTTGKPLETSPQNGRERDREIAPGGSPQGGEHERLARDILHICFETDGCWDRKQANRLRHPHKTAANGACVSLST